MLEFSQQVLSLCFRTLFFRSIPPLFWTLFYCWCLNELNSRAMLKHCIFTIFGRDFELAAVTAFSKKLKKDIFCIDPRFPLNFTKISKTVARGSPQNLFGGQCRGLIISPGRFNAVYNIEVEVALSLRSDWNARLIQRWSLNMGYESMRGQACNRPATGEHPNSVTGQFRAARDELKMYALNNKWFCTCTLHSVLTPPLSAVQLIYTQRAALGHGAEQWK